MNESYVMCISDVSTAIEILASKFLVVMETMLKHNWWSFFIGTFCTHTMVPGPRQQKWQMKKIETLWIIKQSYYIT